MILVASVTLETDHAKGPGGKGVAGGSNGGGDHWDRQSDNCSTFFSSRSLYIAQVKEMQTI